MFKQATTALSAGSTPCVRPVLVTRLSEISIRANMSAAPSYRPAFGNGDTPHYGL